MEVPTEATGDTRAADRAPAREAGRYALRGLLGVGGFGSVYRAVDELTGEEVAVKRVTGLDAAGQNRLRRELAALRWLQMPGVVTLRDDGPTEGGWFIVMDVVDGVPFPGDRKTWATLRDTALGLFETLARIHAAGVVHRDVKPSNVLVRPDGAPVVLDFGVARGAAVRRPLRRSGELTPGWAAPEVRRGADADARADLWAAGRMVELALGADVPPGLPPLLRRLTAPAPGDRPRDADEVVDALLALEGRSAEVAGFPEAPHDRDELVALFAGPEPFQHLASDPADLLFARTGGDPRSVAEELERWRRAGLARREGQRWRLDRVAVDQLRAATTSPRGRRRAESDAAVVVPQARLDAARHLQAGQPSAALAVLGVGLAAARAAGAARGLAPLPEGTGEGPLLEDWVTAALALESAVALDRALYELDRAEAPVAPALLALVRGGRAAYRGETARALEDLDQAAGLSEELEAWRQGLRVRALARQGVEAEAAALDALDDWAAGDPARLDRVEAWRGNLAYRQGAYGEAARLHLRCVGRRSRPDRRVSARLNAAYALLDDLQLSACAEQAQEAHREARALRHPVYEGYATWALRAVDYRLDRAGAPRPDLVDAAAPLRVHLLAQLALNEAAVAWRCRDPVAGELALRGRAAFERLGQREPARLCGALALVAGVPQDAAGDQPAGGAHWAVPDLAAQTLALCALAGHPLGGEVPGGAVDLAAWAASRPPAERDVRLDVLSTAECLAALGYQP